MTGLAPRADLNRVLESMCRDGTADPATVVICDVVGLKAINARHGFTAGDATLRRAAERLRDAAAEASILARLGGDEFVAVFSGPNSLEPAHRAVGRLEADGEPALRAAALTAKKGEMPDALVDRLYAAMRGS